MSAWVKCLISVVLAAASGEVAWLATGSVAADIAAVCAAAVCWCAGLIVGAL